jgi:hypothetical protein
MPFLCRSMCGVGRNERLSRWQRIRRRVALELRYFLVRRLSGNASRVDLESFPKEGGIFRMPGDALLLNGKKGLPVSVADQAAPRLALRAPFPSVLASSRMPTRMSPHSPTSAPQSAQVTRLSSVELSGTTNLLLPHLGHLRGASGMARDVHSS